ncbi:hypothetical protein [Providencia manganoxydans]|uniref:hypothetical protein n=1 Tax=Providencia manganoxydans TaxID=2923283 RepID=UPI0034E3E93B
MRLIGESIYLRNLAVIMAFKDKSPFTVDDMHRLTKLNRCECQESIRLLLPIGAIQRVSKCNDTRGVSVYHYHVAPNAESLLNSVRRSVRKASAQKVTKKKVKHSPKRPSNDEPCGYKVVKKADVSGMGWSYLNHLDQLLAGVRP